MRFILLILALLFSGGAAAAVTVDCEVPNSFNARGLELCELARQSFHVRAADWSVSDCATQALRLQFRNWETKFTNQAGREAAAAATSTAIQTFEANFPIQYTRAKCGDDIVDTEFGETCDDGNTISGDGCDEGCISE